MPKVIFNIAFTSKNPPRNMSPQKKVEYIARRNFYNMTAKYNYFKYILDEEKVLKNKDILSYMQKDSGVFNLGGALSSDDIKEIEKKIKTTDSNIWHGVISFDAETSKGIKTSSDAARFMRQTFSAFLQRTHLNPNNLELFAAVHNDTDNRHIHFSFFEKEPKRRDKNGKLCYTAKGSIAPYAIENYLVSANMHMSENSRDYYTARDRAMEKFKELRAKGLNYGTKELRQKVEQLITKLPTSGRLQYNADNLTSLRKDIDEVADLFIKSDAQAYRFDKQFKAVLAGREAEARTLCTSDVSKQFGYVNNRELKTEEVQQLLRQGKTEYTRANKISWENIDYFERLRQDYKARVGNLILGVCKDFKKDLREKNRATFNDRQKKIASRTQRRHQYKVINDFMNIFVEYQRGIQADFTKDLERIQQEVNANQYILMEYNS